MPLLGQPAVGSRKITYRICNSALAKPVAQYDGGMYWRMNVVNPHTLHLAT